MVLITNVASWILLVSGSVVLMLSALGIVRLPTFFTRLHAASVNETLGPGLILLGLALQSLGNFEIAFKLGLIFLFLILTGPVASHAMAKAATENGVMPGATRPRKGGRSSKRR